MGDDKVQLAFRTLMDEADQLEKWAAGSLSGGWSTHLVEPMRKRATELRAVAAKLIDRR